MTYNKEFNFYKQVLKKTLEKKFTNTRNYTSLV